MVVSTLVAKYVGYWLAFLITSIATLFALSLLVVGRNLYGTATVDRMTRRLLPR